MLFMTQDLGNEHNTHGRVHTHMYSHMLVYTHTCTHTPTVEDINLSVQLLCGSGGTGVGCGGFFMQ